MIILSAESIAPIVARPDVWTAPLTAALNRFEIDTPQRAAMFLGTCAHESARFTKTEEDLRYSGAALLRVWPTRFSEQDSHAYAYRPESIANRAYAHRGGNGAESSGDGWRFRGRGPIQITLRANYAEAGSALRLPLLTSPDMLLEPRYGALSSAWYWYSRGCNDVADEGDFAGVSGIINRGSRNKAALNLDDRFQWYEVAQRAVA